MNTLEFIAVDSITMLDARARGQLVMAASHAGLYAGQLAASIGLAAVILCDAGVGRDRAGIAALDFLGASGIPVAAIGHRSARIGDAADCLARGRITFANQPALRLGAAAGMSVMDAIGCLRQATATFLPTAELPQESRRRILFPSGGLPDVWALNSASLVRPCDKNSIVITGSHGGLLGGRPETAIKLPVLAAVYNDADRGVDDAGLGRLPALDAQGIAGATVSAWSARIGDGMSTYEDGIISAINPVAASLGAEVGSRTISFVAALRKAFHERTVA